MIAWQQDLGQFTDCRVTLYGMSMSTHLSSTLKKNANQLYSNKKLI